MGLDEQRLYDILEAIEAINRYAVLGKEEFEHNELIQVWNVVANELDKLRVEILKLLNN